ncbi:MAG TPA: hypothetical protein PK074_12475, partial [Spirochaetales bacterium]|nr:hypothetical protein [Spirochaetales bacterium]
MPMTPYSGDVEIITNIGTTPQERGLSTDEFKAKFDEGLKAFVTWFNDTHKTEFDAHLAEEASVNALGHIKAVTSPITYYVDINRPDNSGDGLTPATAFKNLQYAINKVPKYLKATVKIRVMAGDYSTENQIFIEGFYGSGDLIVTAFDGVSEVTSQDSAVNYKVSAFYVLRCNTDITVHSFTS